jgi:hypothetical protein
MNEHAKEWIIGNDDSLVWVDEEDLMELQLIDEEITYGLGLILSSKSFVAPSGVFFEEYEDPDFFDKSIRSLCALTFVRFCQNRTQARSLTNSIF